MFSSVEYTRPTPAWALIGAAEQGFDPMEMRWRRKNKKDNPNVN